MTIKKAYSCQEKSFAVRVADFVGKNEDPGFDSYRMFPVFFELRIRRRMIEDDF
jgi:hypothetical protein